MDNLNGVFYDEYIVWLKTMVVCVGFMYWFLAFNFYLLLSEK